MSICFKEFQQEIWFKEFQQEQAEAGYFFSAMARGYWHKGKSGEGVGQLRYLLYREDTPGIWPLKNFDNCS